MADVPEGVEQFHGILACGTLGGRLTKDKTSSSPTKVPVCEVPSLASQQSASGVALPRGCHTRYTWAELMKRVWEVDVLECHRCRGRMRIMAGIHGPRPFALEVPS